MLTIIPDEEIRALQRGMPLRSTDFNTMKRCLKAQLDHNQKEHDRMVREIFEGIERHKAGISFLHSDGYWLEKSDLRALKESVK